MMINRLNWKILRQSCSGPFQDTTTDLITTTNNINPDSGYLGGYSNLTIEAARISSGGGREGGNLLTNLTFKSFKITFTDCLRVFRIEE
jgi:hypothetical protein